MHFDDNFLEDYFIHGSEHWAADHFRSLLSKKTYQKGWNTYLFNKFITTIRLLKNLLWRLRFINKIKISIKYVDSIEI